MTRHSTLTNPNDLHYAKVRSFTGDPANLTPDFADELIIATDTNKIYRATDTAQGAIVELVAGGGDGITISYTPPEGRPDKEGKMHFDQWANGELYISVANYFGAKWWKPIKPMVNTLLVTTEAITDDANLNAAATFCLMYSSLTPAEIEAGSFTFSDVAQADLGLGDFDLTEKLNFLGTGCYAIGYSGGNPNGLSLAVDINYSLGDVPYGFEVRDSPNSVVVNGVSVARYLHVFAKANSQLHLTAQLINIVIGG